MDNQLQALVKKWRERAAGYLRSAGTLDSFELVRDITTAITRAYERMAADRTECADELAALLAQRAPQENVCDCNGGEQGDGLCALPHEATCASLTQRAQLQEAEPDPAEPRERCPRCASDKIRPTPEIFGGAPKMWCDTCENLWNMQPARVFTNDALSPPVSERLKMASEQLKREAQPAPSPEQNLVAHAKVDQQAKVIQALTADLSRVQGENAVLRAQLAIPTQWTCFHCGETFTTPGAARDHFGAAKGAEPGCLIEYRVALEEGGKPERGRGLLMALRKAEAALFRVHGENETLRALLAQREASEGDNFLAFVEALRADDPARELLREWREYNTPEPPGKGEPPW